MSFKTWWEGFGYEPGEVRTIKRAAEDGYNAGAAEKAAELTALMECKHPKAVATFTISSVDNLPERLICPLCDAAHELAAITKERDVLKASFQLRVIELHIEQNGSGLPLKGYGDCSHHTFETCTSPKCITAREILFASRKEDADE